MQRNRIGNNYLHCYISLLPPQPAHVLSDSSLPKSIVGIVSYEISQ